jgi:hypothetical protein
VSAGQQAFQPAERQFDGPAKLVDFVLTSQAFKHNLLAVLTSQAFKHNLLAVLDFMGNLSRREHEQPKTMDCAMEGFADEACSLPLHLAGGGSGLCTGD